MLSVPAQVAITMLLHPENRRSTCRHLMYVMPVIRYHHQAGLLCLHRRLIITRRSVFVQDVMMVSSPLARVRDIYRHPQSVMSAIRLRRGYRRMAVPVVCLITQLSCQLIVRDAITVLTPVVRVVITLIVLTCVTPAMRVIRRPGHPLHLLMLITHRL